MPLRVILRDNETGTLLERYLIDANEMIARDPRFEIIDRSDFWGNVWVTNLGYVDIAARYQIAPEHRAP